MRIRSVSMLSLALAFVSIAPTAQAQAGATDVASPPPMVQSPAAATNGAPVTDPSGPRREAAVAGVQVQSTAEAPAPAPLQARRNRTSLAATLTIVGAAAFIGGLLIGDDAGNAIAVVGLGVGLVGLYQWLR